MTVDTKSRHITPAGGNVFADLGFPEEEAVKLLADSDRVISEKLAIKEQLMTEITIWIKAENLRQVDAAHILGVTRPRVSDVIHKKVFNFTIDSLVDMLARTGKHVEMLVR